MKKFYLNNSLFFNRLRHLSFGLMAVMCLIFLPALCTPARSQNSTENNVEEVEGSAPIEITAQDTLEWDRENKTYTAMGNAVAKQEDTVLKAETLIADYKLDNQDKITIWRIRAKTGVSLSSSEGTAYGDQAHYIVSSGKAEMTGKNLKLVSPDQIITARDKFEYYSQDNKFIALGNVVAQRKKDTLKADKMIAYFKNGSGDKETLDKLEAIGNVVIITPDETLYGRAGDYDPDTKIAEIVGNVRIERGPNLLTGNRASVNLNTNISRVYGSKGADQKVKGLFFPQSDDNSDQNKTEDQSHNVDIN